MEQEPKNRKKLLIENLLVYGLGGVISKAIPLVMVPIITRLMPSSFYYGMDDLTNTIISLFTSIAVMGMYDALFRLFFDKEDQDYRKSLCSSAFVFTMIMAGFVSGIMVLLREPISQLFYSDPSYGNLVMLAAIGVFVGATNSIMVAPTRMKNQKAAFLITNALVSCVSYGISIPLLLNGYYLIALPIAGILASVLGELAYYFMNRSYFSFKNVNWRYIKSMVAIGLPLLPNFLFYWVFNSSDKVMITNMLGANEEGLYAIASKFGQASQLIYTAFAGGWQYFAFSVMRDKDNKTVISKVFEILALVSLMATLAVTCCCKWLIQWLFESEYWPAYICVPYLFLSPLLLMLFQVGSNQLLTIKHTLENFIALAVGAGANIGLNYLLIPLMGMEGASLATFIGYFLSILIILVIVYLKKLMFVRLKTIVFFILFLLVFIAMRLNSLSWYWMNIPLTFLFCLLVFLFYYKDYKKYLPHRRLGKKEN
jgi:O-antigen/teichoic acid export membrane protein